MRELERAVEDFIDKIVGVAQAVAFQSDCDATELVGQMISVLNGRRHDIERFMREGSELWLDGTFMLENGTLSYRAANGKIMTPDKLRTELFVTGNKRAFPLPPPPKEERHGD